MSKEKETEKIISDKLNSREFAFDEKGWAGMETLLDAQQKKRKIGFFWYFSASMLIVLVAGAAYYFTPESKKNTNVTLNVPDSYRDDESGKQNPKIDAQSSTKFDINSVDEQNISKTDFVEKQAKTGKNSLKNGLAATNNKIAIADNKIAAAENETAATNNEITIADNKIAATNNEIAIADNKIAAVDNEVPIADNETVITNNEISTVENETVTVENEQDSIKTAEQTPEIETKNPLTAPGKETKNAWGVLAGVGYWYQYQQTPGATNHKGGFPFTCGIYYQRLLSKRLDLGLSIVYSSRGALNFDKTVTNSNYGFGVESDITTISPQTLHYLNVPFHIRFNISQRSHIIIGAAYYQLLATTSKVTHTIESSFASTLTSSEKQTGEHKGFLKNDIAAFIGYELTLFDRMNAGLQFSYGFYDNTVNGYNGSFNGADSFDRNISLQLQLKYDLIRH